MKTARWFVACAASGAAVAFVLCACEETPTEEPAWEPLQFLGLWGTEGTGDGEFLAPTGAAVASDGTVYVADFSRHDVQYFTAAGSFLGRWGEYGDDDGEFQHPWGLAVARDGMVYVADSHNHRVQYFTADGSFLGKWGKAGGGDGEFDTPTGIAAAPNGNVYVSDQEGHCIHKLSSEGQLLTQLTFAGTSDPGAPGQISFPTGVAVDADGNLYVAETGCCGNWIIKFAPVTP